MANSVCVSFNYQIIKLSNVICTYFHCLTCVMSTLYTIQSIISQVLVYNTSSLHWAPKPTTNTNHCIGGWTNSNLKKTLHAKNMFIIIQQILLNIGFIAHMAGTAAATLGCRSEKLYLQHLKNIKVRNFTI